MLVSLSLLCVPRPSRANLPVWRLVLGVSPCGVLCLLQVEMLLEAYLMQVDNTCNKLQTLHEYIDDTEV